MELEMCGCSPQTPIQSWSEEGRYLGVQELRLCGNAADGLEAALVRLSKDDLAIKELSLSLGYADWDAGDAMRLLKMAQGLPQLTALNVTLLSFSNEDQVACFTEYLGSTEVVPVLALRLSFGFMPVKQPLLILSQVFDRCQLLELVVDMPLTWEDFHLLCELLYSSPALKGLEKLHVSHQGIVREQGAYRPLAKALQQRALQGLPRFKDFELRACICFRDRLSGSDLIEAFTSEVDPSLERFVLASIDVGQYNYYTSCTEAPEGVFPLIVSHIQRGGWPALRELFLDDAGSIDISPLLRALLLMPNLEMLGLVHVMNRFSQAANGVAEWLAPGSPAHPRLSRLDLTGSLKWQTPVFLPAIKARQHWGELKVVVLRSVYVKEHEAAELQVVTARGGPRFVLTSEIKEAVQGKVCRSYVEYEKK